MFLVYNQYNKYAIFLKLAENKKKKPGILCFSYLPDGLFFEFKRAAKW